MWYAGIGWRADSYLVSVLDDVGSRDGDPHVFGADQIDRLLDHLSLCRQRAGRLACVIDTTTGVLERHLVEAGFLVHRADPWLAGRHRVDGSADPATLAELGRRHLKALPPLILRGGGLDGRDVEVAAAIRAGAELEAGMVDRGELIVRGDRRRRQIALTFDDGPGPFTAAVLEVLRRHGAVATFFCVGLQAHAHPHLLEQIVAGGHELANHTWSHPYLPDLSAEELAVQVGRTNDSLRRVTGQEPVFVRPPYGGRDPAVMRWLAASGLVTVLWDVEAADWELPGAQAIEAAILDNVRNGSIVLLHDGSGDRSQTVAALAAALPRLAAQGYEFVPVSRFLTAGGEGTRAFPRDDAARTPTVQ